LREREIWLRTTVFCQLRLSERERKREKETDLVEDNSSLSAEALREREKERERERKREKERDLVEDDNSLLAMLM
jgi:hypothetical protein